MSTLLSLRAQAANRINALLGPSTITAVGTDSLGTIVDSKGPVATEPTDSLAGSWLYITSGASAGAVREIAGNTDGEISLRVPLANAPSISDTFEVYRRFRPADIRDAINVAIRNAFPLLYARFEQEVPEDVNTLEYLWPSLVSPAPSLQALGATGTNWWYAVVTRDVAGDAPPLAGVLISAAATGNVKVSWTALSNADAYLILRSSVGVNGPWFLQGTVVASPVGTAMSYTDNATNGASYTPATIAPQMAEIRQLWRRRNPATTASSGPPAYQEIPGSMWYDFGGKVGIRWRPSAGQFLLMVGYAANAELVNDVDNSTLPDELIIAGTAQNLYQNLLAGEAASSNDFFDKQQARWGNVYEKLKLRYAYEPIGRESHPPLIRIAKGIASDLTGPIVPAP